MTWHTIDHVQPCMTPTQRTKRRGCILTDSILAALLHLHVHSIIHSLAMLISRTNPIFEGKQAAGSARDSLCSLCNATLHCTLVSALSIRLVRPQALVVVCFIVSPKHWRFQARASPGIARGQNSGQFVGLLLTETRSDSVAHIASPGNLAAETRSGSVAHIACPGNLAVQWRRNRSGRSGFGRYTF